MSIKKGDIVIVPEPIGDDYWSHSFQGYVLRVSTCMVQDQVGNGIHEETDAIVEDQDGNAWAVPVDRLIVI